MLAQLIHYGPYTLCMPCHLYPCYILLAQLIPQRAAYISLYTLCMAVPCHFISRLYIACPAYTLLVRILFILFLFYILLCPYTLCVFIYCLPTYTRVLVFMCRLYIAIICCLPNLYITRAIYTLHVLFIYRFYYILLWPLYITCAMYIIYTYTRVLLYTSCCRLYILYILRLLPVPLYIMFPDMCCLYIDPVYNIYIRAAYIS